MTTPTLDDNLLAHRAGVGTPGLGSTPLNGSVATKSHHAPSSQEADTKLGATIDRIRPLRKGTSSTAAVAAPSSAAATVREPPRSSGLVPQNPSRSLPPG